MVMVKVRVGVGVVVVFLAGVRARFMVGIRRVMIRIDMRVGFG